MTWNGNKHKKADSLNIYCGHFNQTLTTRVDSFTPVGITFEAHKLPEDLLVNVHIRVTV